MLNYKTLGTQVVLSVIAVFTSWLLITTLFDADLQKKLDIYKPDAFMENVHAVYFNEQGFLETVFFSPKMWHFPAGNTTQMINPRFYIYNIEQKSPWLITALNGKAYGGAKRLELWNNVRGHQQASVNNTESTLQTEQIMVYPAKKYAETAKEVTASQPGLIVKSEGARINLQTHIVTLLTKVRGEYVPMP